METLQVECQTREPGAVPHRFGRPGAMQEVAEVIDRWPGEGYRYFRVRTSDSALYILRHDERADSWQISVFEAGSPARGTRPAKAP